MKLSQAKQKSYSYESKMARDELILKNLPQVKWIAKRIAGHFASESDMEDLILAGIMGLIDAAERYDPSMENKFMTYATFRIRGAILSELRSRDFVSRSARKKIRDIEEAAMKIEQEKGRHATDEEIAEQLGIDIDKVRETQKIASISFVSIEELNGPYAAMDKNNILKHLISGEEFSPFGALSLEELENVIADAIDKLSEKEKLVISMYYWDELTMKEIGKVLDITESRVSQIHSRAITRLRLKLKEVGYMG